MGNPGFEAMWRPGGPRAADSSRPCLRLQKVPGAFGVDATPLPGVDLMHDLNALPYPFPSTARRDPPQSCSRTF